MANVLAEIEVKNYRCFSDECPLRFKLIDGLVAIVGQNNSGKTAILKFIIELRKLWRDLADRNTPANVYRGGARFEFHAVSNQSEAFHNGNDRPIEITLAFSTSAEVETIEVLTVEVDRYMIARCSLARTSTGRILESHNIAGFTSPNMFLPVEAACTVLANAYMVDYHRHATPRGSTLPEMLSGQALLQSWADLKFGSDSKNIALAIQIEQHISRIFEFQSLQINIFANDRGLQLIIDGRSFRLNEVGAGIEQFIVVIINLLAKTPQLVLIDEPERGLHPALQRELMRFIADNANGRVIFATHSIGLARTMADHIYVSKRECGHSVIKPFESARNLTEYLGELSFSSWREFGCDAVLLVEGVKDIRAMLALLSQHTDGTRIAILPMGGSELIKAGSDQDLAELQRVHDHIFVLIDRETESEHITEPKRVAFVKRCKELGFECCMTQRRALENYFTDDAVKAAIGPQARALTAYEKFDGANTGWGKGDGWKIAKAINWPDICETDFGQFVGKMLAVCKPT
jgi:hypothetical protein